MADDSNYSSSSNTSRTVNPVVTDQLKIGSTLANRYLIEGILGVGGMGAVYRARDLHFPNVVKHVAVKEMIIQTRDASVRASIVRNFEREADLLATLDHPSIPRIFDYFTSHDRSYLILELINGKTLEELIEENIPVPQVIQWAIEICDVLHYLHNHQPEPIIFRDMKPSNVMINQYNRVKLIDFGIAKPFRGDQKGTMVGTEGYSPPEQYRGEATLRADIYSLGATLHHFLTRKDPRLEAPFSFGERPIRQLNPNVPEALEKVIFKALQYNPDDRFASALEMKNALEAILQPTARTDVNKPLVHQSGQSNIHPLWVFECSDEIRGAPSYVNQWLFFGSYDHHLYTVNAQSGELVWKYATDGPIVCRPMIIEGNVIVGSADCRLHAVNERTGKIYWSYYTQGAIWSSPAFAAGHVFFGSDDFHLHAVNLSTSNASWKMDAGAQIRSTPYIHEDGIYFGNEYGDFFCLDYRGKVRWRFKAKRAVTGSAISMKNSIFFGSLDSTVYALDAKTGWALWRFRLGKATISTPCIWEDYLFIGCTDGNLYCIDVRTAKEVWRFQTQHQVTGSAIADNGYVYFGSVDGYLYCVEASSGNLKWKFPTGGAITGTPLIAENILFIGATDGKMYALPIS